MNTLGHTQDGRMTIAILTQEEVAVIRCAPLLVDLVKQANEILSRKSEAPSSESPCRRVAQRSKAAPIKPARRHGNFHPAPLPQKPAAAAKPFRRSPNGGKPIWVRVEEYMANQPGRQATCAELVKALRLPSKPIACCIAQNPDLFKRLAYGRYSLKASGTQLPAPSKSDRLAAIKAAAARLEERDPLESATAAAAQIRAEEG